MQCVALSPLDEAFLGRLVHFLTPSACDALWKALPGHWSLSCLWWEQPSTND